MRKSTEKVIPDIILKYYKISKKNDFSMPFFKCYWCLEPSNRSGGVFFDKKGKIQQICENCAISRYKDENNFKTLKAAKARRRRIFDVGYLFNETVLDLYMSEKGIKDLDACSNADDIFIKASELYNILFSKEDKISLEEMYLQKDIESQINNRLLSVDFNKFFLNL